MQLFVVLKAVLIVHFKGPTLHLLIAPKAVVLVPLQILHLQEQHPLSFSFHFLYKLLQFLTLICLPLNSSFDFSTLQWRMDLFFTVFCFSTSLPRFPEDFSFSPTTCAGSSSWFKANFNGHSFSSLFFAVSLNPLNLSLKLG